MDDKAIEWFVPAAGSHASRGEFATISAAGYISVSGELVAELDLQAKPYARLGRDKRTDRLIVEPTADADGAWVWNKAGKGKGAMRRFNPRQALRLMGLIPARRVRVKAWIDGRYLIIENPEGKAEDAPHSPPAEPRATSHVPRATGHEPRATGHEPRATSDAAAQACGTCHHRGWGICRCGLAPDDRRHRRVDPGQEACDQYKPSKAQPPSPAIVEPPKGRRGPSPGGRRQRAKCPVSDHDGKDFPVTARGLYPHDVNGVMYLAGRGDKKKRCPGSHAQA